MHAGVLHGSIEYRQLCLVNGAADDVRTKTSFALACVGAGSSEFPSRWHAERTACGRLQSPN